MAVKCCTRENKLRNEGIIINSNESYTQAKYKKWNISRNGFGISHLHRNDNKTRENKLRKEEIIKKL